MRPNKDDFTLLALCTKEYKGYVSALEKGRFRDGIRHILSISRHGNQYMQSNQPWVLLNGSDDEKWVFFYFAFFFLHYLWDLNRLLI